MSLQDHNLTIKRVTSGYYTVRNEYNNLEWELMTVDLLLNRVKDGAGYDDLKAEVTNTPKSHWILINAYGGYTFQDGATTYKTKAECIGHIEFVNEN